MNSPPSINAERRAENQMGWLFPLALLCMVFGPRALAQHSLEAELGVVIPGYNDVGIPGDTGTRFSLTEDLTTEASASYRIRYGHRLTDEHWIGVLAAPLRSTSDGVLARNIDFNGTVFSAGSTVKATFIFNSYRLIYRYRLYDEDQFEFDLGGALKVREASIRLRNGTLSSEKSNVGLVPLLSFGFAWDASDRIRLLVDGEALAAPQGRAEDVLFAARYQATPSLALRAGYRILEGGADNDEVYTFSLFHQLVIGAHWTF